jgi:hypothetical protein
MPVAYTCDRCGAPGGLGAGWIVVATSGHEITEDGSRKDALATREWYFHTRTCYDQWSAQEPRPA